MIKIGEETLENGQVLEVFQNGNAIIKQPKSSENPIVVKETMITKAKFLKRITFEELNKITNYEFFTTGADKAQKDMAMKTLWTFFNTFEMVNLSDDAWVSDFVQVIVWTGLMSLERILQVVEI